MKTTISTVGDLIDLLGQYDENMNISFGTNKLGFEIDHHRIDGISLALISNELDELLEKDSEIYKKLREIAKSYKEDAESMDNVSIVKDYLIGKIAGIEFAIEIMELMKSL